MWLFSSSIICVTSFLYYIAFSVFEILRLVSAFLDPVISSLEDDSQNSCLEVPQTTRCDLLMGHESIEVGPAVSPLKKEKKKRSGLENSRVYQTKAVL